MRTDSRKTVSLVLGSGGARGLAHIGIIHWLEEHDFVVESISGCSMGALVGGVYAAGKLDEFEHWVRAVTKMDIVTLLDLSWSADGLVKGDRIIDTLRGLIGDMDIEELPMRYTAVAADIEAEKEVWINTGKLFDAIRASISLPLFFTPFDYNGTQLLDGGILNPVPIAPTFYDRTDITVAVNLGAKADHLPVIQSNRHPLNETEIPYMKKIGDFISSFKGAQDRQRKKWDMYRIADQAFDAMQSTIARQKLATYNADYTIEIARNACGTLAFDLADKMIALGYQKAGEELAV